jgi:hypothetical protein
MRVLGRLEKIIDPKRRAIARVMQQTAVVTAR